MHTTQRQTNAQHPPATPLKLIYKNIIYIKHTVQVHLFSQKTQTDDIFLESKQLGRDAGNEPVLVLFNTLALT